MTTPMEPAWDVLAAAVRVADLAIELKIAEEHVRACNPMSAEAGRAIRAHRNEIKAFNEARDAYAIEKQKNEQLNQDLKKQGEQKT